MSLSSIEFRRDIDTRLEEGEEVNVERIWRGKSKECFIPNTERRKDYLLYISFFSL